MIGRLVAMVIAGAGAGSLSQFPEFVQQYSQRLAGRIDELQRFVQEFDRDAQRAGLTRQQAIEEYRLSESEFLGARQGRVADTIERYEGYQDAKARLQEAGPFGRLIVFARNYDGEIAGAAWEDYKPAVPLTMEGLVHAGGGLVAGLGLGWFLVGGTRAAGRQITKAWDRDKNGSTET